MNLVYPLAELWIQGDPTAHVARCARVCYASALGVGDEKGGLACCSSWGRKESDTTDQLN